jgi:uncharacterized protein YdhG (YjbR/CyaY superfamily)
LGNGIGSSPFKIQQFVSLAKTKPMAKPLTVDGYIAGYPEDVQKKLAQMRGTIKRAAPGAEEVISYSMPAYKLNGMLVWFAAHTNHLGLYPRGSGIETFKDELADYKCSKGTIQFPLNKPLPLALITKIVKFRVKENLLRAKKVKK